MRQSSEIKFFSLPCLGIPRTATAIELHPTANIGICKLAMKELPHEPCGYQVRSASDPTSLPEESVTLEVLTFLGFLAWEVDSTRL